MHWCECIQQNDPLKKTKLFYDFIFCRAAYVTFSTVDLKLKKLLPFFI